MLISVLNIKLICEWHKAIKLNYKITRTHVIVILRVPSTIHENAQRWRNMAVANVSWIAVIWHHTQGRKWIRLSLTGTVCGPARRPYYSLAIISVTVQLWKLVFWVISVYFNIRNTLPKSGTFLLGYPDKEADIRYSHNQYTNTEWAQKKKQK